MQPKYGMVIDASKCLNCKACIVACQLENHVPAEFTRAWIKETSPDNGMTMAFQPGNCMQCDRPTCVEACPVNATYKAKDGRVVINPALCIGCELCIPACPYGARFLHPLTNVADKCDFCAKRLRQGLEPACVVTCPTGVRLFGDFNDASSRVSQLLKQGGLVRVVNPKADTEPNIYYFANTVPLDWPKEPEMPTLEELKDIRGS
jgi:Fe-S-cluster-containing dehydrogenase component